MAKRLEKFSKREKRGLVTDSSIRNWVQREKAKKQKCIEVSKGFSPLFLHFPYSKDFSCF